MPSSLTPFLKQIAEKLVAHSQTHNIPLSDMCVVLPSQRACMYFKHYLTEVVGGNVLAPTTLMMEDFVTRLANIEIADNISLLLELFRTYKEFDKNIAHNLEAFAPLGTVILRDFGMIDKNLTHEQAKAMFEYLQDVKAIERWSKELGEDSPLSKGEKSKLLDDYFAFWQYLQATYFRFKEKLLAQNRCYSGLAYSIVYQNIAKLWQQSDFQYIVFAGFNQFNKTEENIILWLVERKKAGIYWDIDDYYMNNPFQEAGKSIQHYIDDLKEVGYELEDFGIKENNIATQTKKIRIVGSNYVATQAKTASLVLEEYLKDFFKDEKTVEQLIERINYVGILLPDEDLLFPLLQSLPTQLLEAQKTSYAKTRRNLINITMGAGMKTTMLFKLIEYIFNLQQNIKRVESTPQAPSNGSFYYKDVLNILQHPLVRFIDEEQQLFDTTQNEIKYIYANNLVRIDIQSLLVRVGANGFLTALFADWQNNTANAIHYFYKLIQAINFTSSAEDTYSLIEREFLLKFYNTLKRLEGLPEIQQNDFNISTFKHFLFELLAGISVPFTGEPISAVQLMGMMETRAIDFEKVIILSCNEGIFPQGKVVDSIIPFDVRRTFKMPTYQDTDSLTAYRFYRLLQRANEITLIYSQTSGDIRSQSGERSRFITQILHELKNYPNIEIIEETTPTVLPEINYTEAVVKDETLIELIKKRLKDGRSPSALISYLTNPIEFFFQYILKIQEMTEVEESLNSRTFGILLHGTLETLFKPYLQQTITADTLYTLQEDTALIEMSLKTFAATDDALKGMQMEEGKNYILNRVIVQLCANFLKKEAELLAEKKSDLHIVGLEMTLEHSLQIPLSSGETVTFRLVGTADRIDIKNNTLRVIDYKTGSFKKNNLKATNTDELFRKPEKSKIIQLLLYKYLVIKALNKDTFPLPENIKHAIVDIESGFYFFKKLSDGYILYELDEEPKDRNEFCSYVEDFIVRIVNDLLSNKPFTSLLIEDEEETEDTEVSND
jgi:RecB family exonuclease